MAENLMIANDIGNTVAVRKNIGVTFHVTSLLMSAPLFIEEEDEIQFLYQTAPSPVACAICNESLDHLTHEERQLHYDFHFEGANASGPASKSRSMAINSHSSESGPSKPSSKKENVSDEQDENEFWIPAYGTQPPENCTPCLVAVLRRTLVRSHAKGLTQRAALCRNGVCHIATQDWDSGWGCGYRNFMMSCTALIDQLIQPMYFPLLSHGKPPGVRNLQAWIESAWDNGYDDIGAEQLKYKLIGTNQWIGTGELYVAFTSRGIPCKLVDFPKSSRGPVAVTEWVRDYFYPPQLRGTRFTAYDALNGATAVTQTELMPLILQHQGHSRTIVGIEMNKSSLPNLLILDPAKRPSLLIRKAALATFSLSSHVSSPLPSKQLPNRRHTPGLKRKLDDSRFGEDDEIQEIEGPIVKKARQDNDDPIRLFPGVAANSARNGKGKSTSNVPQPNGNSGVRGDGGSLSPSKEPLDPVSTLRFFRLTLSQLSKHDRYQILWFPLDPPLDDAEKWERRVVTSERAL